PALGAAGRVAEGERSVGTLEILGRHASGLLFPTCPQTDHSFLKQPGSEGGLYPLFGGGALALWIAALIWALRREHASKSHARGMRGRRRLASALLWMALLSLPSLHLIPIGALWAGRFLFLPLIGFSLAVVALSDLLPRPLRWVPMLWLLALVVAGTVSIRDRAFDWVSPRTLWEAEVARHPEHAFAWKNLAVCLQRDGEVTEALVAGRRATALWPQFGEGWLARGQIARALDLEEEAASALAEAERLLPDDATVQIERAKLEALQGRFEEAEGRLERLLERQPGHAEARDLLDLIRRDPRRR
ncbi:hypothetical protein JXA47_00170, partial [Candidatus Sumerlaeota bacterium]|nr:hypothetical protein [Candidatus Sumerlaeota bacterium]